MADILPVGKYRARAVDGALGETKTGKEQVAIQFEVLSEGWEGHTITWYGYFTLKTIKTTMGALRACGWRGDDLADLSGIEDNEIQIVVEHEADPETHEARARVRWVNRAGLALAAPLAPDRACAFAAKMQAYAVQSREAAPPPAPVVAPSGVAAKSAVPPTAPTTPAPASAPAGGGIPIDEEDIPFALLASLGGALSLFGLVSMVA